jgi:hypothetical protein
MVGEQVAHREPMRARLGWHNARISAQEKTAAAWGANLPAALAASSSFRADFYADTCFIVSANRCKRRPSPSMSRRYRMKRSSKRFPSQ